MGPEQRLTAVAGGTIGVKNVCRKHCASLENCALLSQTGPGKPLLSRARMPSFLPLRAMQSLSLLLKNATVAGK